jgi:hypothetical protein
MLPISLDCPFLICLFWILWRLFKGALEITQRRIAFSISLNKDHIIALLYFLVALSTQYTTAQGHFSCYITCFKLRFVENKN